MESPSSPFDLPDGCVLFEDAALIAVDKPAGIPCQAVDPAAPEDLPSLLKRRLAGARGVPPRDVYLGTHQRLDRDTSGVLVYTLAPSANASLAQQFAERSVHKTYLAAVSGKPPAPGALLSDWLAPAPDGRMRIARAGEPGAKQARTRVLEVEPGQGGRSLVRVAIETGRTHQVRLQLSAAGCPVAGDALYGGAPAQRLMLHAQRLALAHPLDARPLAIESPIPLEIGDWFAHGARSVFDDPRLLDRALALAAARRHTLFRAYATGETEAFRWLDGAADGLPGFAIDVYGRFVVVRVEDAPAADEARLCEALQRAGFAGGYVKRHPKQANELIDPRDPRVAPGVPIFGAAAPEALIVREHGVPFEVHLDDGLRTGLFLDQRDNRARIARLARDQRVLNLFGYTGSFSVAALIGGAREVVTVDVSRSALAWAERNAARVGAADRHRSLAEDAFEALRRMAARGEEFDCVILDPPSYSTTKRGRFRAAKDYGALCVAAMSVLRDGGSLLSCLNHEGVSRSALRRFVTSAADGAKRELIELTDLPSGCDFPTQPSGEQGMKSVLARVRHRRRLRSPSESMHKRQRRR